MEEEIIPTKPSDAAGHNPRRRNLVVFSGQLQEVPDVLVGLVPLFSFSLVALGEHECHTNLELLRKKERQAHGVRE